VYDDVKELIDANQEILIFGHKDADGDTLGCSLAFSEALRTAGKDVWVLIPPPLPQMYGFLPGFGDIRAEPPHGVDPQLVFFFDSGNLERSGESVKRIASHATIVNVDKASGHLTVGPRITFANATNGAEQPAWDPNTQRFYTSIPVIANNHSMPSALSQKAAINSKMPEMMSQRATTQNSAIAVTPGWKKAKMPRIMAAIPLISSTHQRE